MSTKTIYRLKKDFKWSINPFSSPIEYKKGDEHTEEIWMMNFPSLMPGGCKTQPDWFEEVNIKDDDLYEYTGDHPFTFQVSTYKKWKEMCAVSEFIKNGLLIPVDLNSIYDYTQQPNSIQNNLKYFIKYLGIDDVVKDINNKRLIPYNPSDDLYMVTFSSIESVGKIKFVFTKGMTMTRDCWVLQVGGSNVNHYIQMGLLAKADKAITDIPGLVPLKIHREQRLQDINEAINRNNLAGIAIPGAWIGEKQHLESCLQPEPKDYYDYKAMSKCVIKLYEMIAVAKSKEGKDAYYYAINELQNALNSPE